MRKSDENLTKASPLLVGIIVDVSSSMQRNWKNRDGNKLPRIEIIRDALNMQIHKFTALSSSNKTRRSIKLFCLGMGFKRPMYLSDVEIKYGHEHELDTKCEKKIQCNVVCDVLALSEIVPSKSKLDKLEATIKKKVGQI